MTGTDNVRSRARHVRPARSRTDLTAVLQRRIVRQLDPALSRRQATVVLDAGEVGSWSVQLKGGRMTMRTGTRGRATTTISASAEVLFEVLSGERCGTEAFLHDEMTVRGDLGLALQLDGHFARQGSPARWPRARQVTADGFRTSYLEAGPPDGETVLLLHGLGATNASMLPTLWDLADRYRVLAPDLPGHGATQARRGRYDAAMFASWADGFLSATQAVGPVVVVGNSLGGRIALEVAFRYPDRVRSLVLFAPAAAFRKLRQFAPLVQVTRHELAVLPLPMSHRMAVLGLKVMFGVPSRVSKAWYDAAADEFQRVFSDRTHRIAFFAALRQIYLDDAFGKAGFWTRLERMRTPALFLWGDRDRLVPAGFARHVVQAVPNARSIVLRTCGHVPQFEMPDETHRLVEEFLADMRDGADMGETSTPDPID